MKKMTAILLVAALLATLCACDKKEEGHPITQKELEEVLYGEAEESAAEEPAQFWLNTHSGTKKPFTGTLFGGQTVPVNLEDFDGRNQPYCWGPNGAFTGQTYDHLSEIVHSNDALRSYWEEGEGVIGGDILPQTRFDEQTLQYVRESAQSDHIRHIYLLNLSREEVDDPSEDGLNIYRQTPVADCYAAGWWYIEADPEALNLDFDPPTEHFFNDTQMEALWDRLGAPDYVAAQDSGLLRSGLRQNSGSLSYEMVYEYNDFVLTVGVEEAILTESSRKQHTLMLTGVRFYTPECWAELQTELELAELSTLGLAELSTLGLSVG